MTPSIQAAPRTDWRIEIPERRRRHLRNWFLAGASLTFLILVIGGITRLTQSGLSIVDWRPIMGVVPPIGEAQWQEAFDRYRQFPEYQQLRRGMTMAEFRHIFFWEYIHRVAARLVGLMFLVPFLVFWARGYFNPPLLRWSLVLFALGASQGLMGWLMVASGLVDRPSVSHFRLAAHLTLALVIFALCIWLAREMSWRPKRTGTAAPASRGLRGVYLLGGLLALQIVWGAFVAGLKAGTIFNTFPLMAGRLVPPGAWQMEPWLMNLLANPATVQWSHRVFGTVLVIAAAAVMIRRLRTGWDLTSRRLSSAFLAAVLAQYLLGVLTLIYRVPVPLGVIHQAAAALILGLWVVWLHHARDLNRSEAFGPPALARSSR